MKKLNIIFSFVLLFFCLLINVSHAEIVANELYTSNASSFSSSGASSTFELEGYTPYNIAFAVRSYIVDGDNTRLSTILSDLSSKGYSKSIIYVSMNGSKPRYQIAIFPDEFEFDFTHFDSNPAGVFDYIGIQAPSNSYYYDYYVQGTSTNGYMNTITTTSDTSVYYHMQLSPVGSSHSSYGSYHFLEFNGISVKEVTDDSDYYIWDGESYFYKAETDPETPPYDLAGIIDVIKNSTEIKDNRHGYLEEYFIVPDGTVGDEEVYEIYFYHNMINLSQFEYVYNDILYYDLDKAFLLDENIIVNLIYWIGQNSYAEIVRDVQLFTLYYNPETGTGDIYLTSNMTLNELKSFNSEIQPIIYTTKDIAYYSATWGETDTEWTAIADESKNILTTEIVDSEGNVINPSVSDSPDLTVIIENVNFDEINKTFEENKGILNIENASWLFTANNKLIGYFIGFLSLLIVFLIISRVLGG